MRDYVSVPGPNLFSRSVGEGEAVVGCGCGRVSRCESRVADIYRQLRGALLM